MTLYTISIFLASALLFLVQPMFAKRLLPVLGGTPSVWNTCMLFYQVMLLFGYIYAHLITQRWSMRKQLIVHSMILLLPLSVLIHGPPQWAPPDGDQAVSWLLAYLSCAVGLPFFVLSTNAPLVQRWFSTELSGSGRSAYFLYSASNLGSMCALIAYPALIEPRLRLSEQYDLLRGSYVLFLLVMAAIVAKCWNRKMPLATVPSSSESADQVLAADTATSAVDRTGVVDRTGAVDGTSAVDADHDREAGMTAAGTAKAVWLERGRWIFLAFVPSSLMLSVTTFLTTDITPCPLLWVVPLGLYLLTFVIAFAPKVIGITWLLRVQALSLVSLCVVFFARNSEPQYIWLAAMHLGTFFITALMCHCLAARARPRASRLTEFYLCLAVGGALGGTFNAIVAPLIFKSLVEYPLVLALSCLARPNLDLFGKRRDWRYGATMIIATLASILVTWSVSKDWSQSWMRYRVFAVVTPAAVVCLAAAVVPPSMMLCLGCILLVGANMWSPESIYQGRNFFGTFVVDNREDGSHTLTNGDILHGTELMREPRPHKAISYYHDASPIGLIFSGYDARLKGAEIAVIGLGAGSMAPYAQAGQEWTFYEINPLMAEISTNPRLFTYLTDCKAPYKIVLGDGRQSIAAANPEQFQLIALDAFSSDAIPTHLLTVEALRIYLSKLKPDGVIVFHISNRMVDLAPTLRELAQAEHLACLIGESRINRTMAKQHKAASKWVCMAKNESVLDPLKANSHFTKMSATPKASLWTDDFSNLLETLRLD